ncbi:Amino-acid binding protein [Pseudomonas savastanoi pv. glycinea]|uniref:Amino-acid binding protein n=3 Tax=Pseudomonas savastanoi TaxID=29438 RepID=A0ABR5L383_PSESG|nr:Amino-acid binding protein [Pseudomonas savastanoi pv. glycinea]KPC31607.1 Amino-acid binding protein [Pseudomonas savastanoi pv. glycinea]KPC38333.1 Amino-acid binding protein [Pseudomonas savastanoi pv. glycinea]KPC52434.1 Amino-acid binding protein [Pseudomonas savastanoi pv. glycinea]
MPGIISDWSAVLAMHRSFALEISIQSYQKIIKSKGQLGSGNIMDASVFDIKKRGYLRVGVSLGLIGLSSKNSEGEWSGFDVDLARAVSVAIFGDDQCIEYFPLASNDRFDALQQNIIDLGCFNSSITFSRETISEVKFCHPMLFDGEMLMTKSAGGMSRPIVSGEIRVAALEGSTTGDNLNRYFREQNLKGVVHLYKTFDDARNAYNLDVCNYYCLDGYLLSGEQTKLRDSRDHVILEQMISREAMSPATLSSKIQLTSAVTWVLRSIIESENIGINSHNLNAFYELENWYIRKYLHPDPRISSKLGISPSFTADVVKNVGNYEEIFERHLGSKSILRQTRRENRLRSVGGLLYSPLFI